MERERQHGLAAHGWLGSHRAERDFVSAGERIWRGAQDRDVVLRVFGDDGDFQKARRSVRAAYEDVRLAAIAKRRNDMRHREQIAFVVDEEGVAEEGVVVAARSRRLVVR